MKRKIYQCPYDELKVRYFPSLRKVLYVCVANSIWHLIFLISMGSMLKTFAEVYLKMLNAIEDSMTGAQRGAFHSEKSVRDF